MTKLNPKDLGADDTKYIDCKKMEMNSPKLHKLNLELTEDRIREAIDKIYNGEEDFEEWADLLLKELGLE